MIRGMSEIVERSWGRFGDLRYGNLCSGFFIFLVMLFIGAGVSLCDELYFRFNIGIRSSDINFLMFQVLILRCSYFLY